MLLPFFYTLRAFKIPVGINEWLTLMETIAQDLNDFSLDKFYYLARAILVKSEALFDAYDEAFLVCFKGREGDFKAKDELLKWLDKMVEGKRPAMPNIPPLTLDELRKNFLERMRQQMEEHHGGSHWIGTGGTSPFGHSGTHPSGIRLGGPGGGRMAVKVAEERRFANYRHDRTLDVRQFKVALKRLKKLEREGPTDFLSIEKSVEKTAKNAGEIELVFEADKKNQTELLLLMDVGGSMDPYIQLMEALFSAAHASKHFKAFHHFYFHNCIYGKVFTNIHRNESVPTNDLFKKFRKSFRLIIVGDACMNPYELFSPGGSIDYWENNPSAGLEWLIKLKTHFSHSIWLNPEPKAYWDHVTIKSVSKVFPMYPLTLDGLSEATDDLRREKVQTAPSSL
ncbi:MAG TPA: VWA containing CoxE family protein [Deltaproteobacteria bacterium]|nr:MAG: VWA containing CoxE family protein [Deltaproteobacteria bacterium GWA2_45_12]HBF13887.1 VWA containing CoxE family protein [Deltaproteobacteria bacterium]